MKNGAWGALGVVGLMAGVSAAVKRTGSTALLTMDDREKLARERGGNLLLKSGSRAEALQQGYVKGNIAQLWKLASDNIYGTSQNLEFIATREALQNSRDAIRKAIRQRLIGKDEGRFDVRWDESTRTIEWEDNGTGMTSQVVFNTFLSLGETTKTAQQQGQAGGFGLAKAVLLGCSEDFRWKMHTLDSIYVSEGLNQPVRRYPAPFYKQGVILTVYNVKAPRWRTSNTVANLLASSDPGIAMTLNGEAVTPAFSGRGTIIAKSAYWGSGVQGTVKSYKRLDSGGAIYVRLKGLTQFIENLQISSDVVVDLDTNLLPTNPNYPFNPSRMALESYASSTFYDLRKELTIDTFSATKKLAEVVLDDDATDPEEIRKNEEAERAITESLISDPDFRSMIEEADTSGRILKSALIQQQKQARGQPQQMSGAQATRKKQQAPPPPAFSDFVDDVKEQAGPISQRQRQENREKIGKKGPKSSANPFAGVGKVRVNTEHWDKKRLAPFVKNKAAMIPLLVLWKLIIRFMLSRKNLGGSFDVGLVFDDNLLAMHEGGRGQGTFYLNPARVVKVIEKSPERPDVVAALLYNSAAHEATHHLGYSYHDEDFAANRQALGDYNVDLLPLFTAATTKLLGVGSGAPIKARKPLAQKAKKLPTIRSNVRFDLDYYRELPYEQHQKLRNELSKLLALRADNLGIEMDGDYIYWSNSSVSGRIYVYNRGAELNVRLFEVDPRFEELESLFIRYAPRRHTHTQEPTAIKDGSFDPYNEVKRVDLAAPIAKMMIQRIEKINEALGTLRQQRSRQQARQQQARQKQARQQQARQKQARQQQARQKQARQKQARQQQTRQQQARQQQARQQQARQQQALYTVPYHVARFKREVMRDVKEGLIPAGSVRSLEDLGNYVDVNEYGGFTDDDYVLYQTDPQRDAKLTEEVWESIDAWIAGGGLR